jgi:heterodisulfide reductase subunit B
MNLDSYQRDVSRLLGREIKMPIIYLTQLMGLVLDLPETEIMLNKNISSPQTVLDKLGK